ncbi:MAG: DUF4276 family protein [Chloroflexota bacterium]
MRIAIIMEGKTEQAFLPHLRSYLKNYLTGNMPKLDPVIYDGRIPVGDKLKRVVENLLSDSRSPADYVIALTDVYTGTTPPDFKDALDAKNKIRQWVNGVTRFYPHAAQYDFESWLLPYWSDIQRLAGHNTAAPAGNPESIDHGNPPSHRIKQIFRVGSSSHDYVKARDAGRILRDNDLTVSVNQCSELKAFVNTIITLCGSPPIL